MREKIFAILYYSSTLNEIKFIGTGFIISKQGDFITAGHTFGKLGQLIFNNAKFRALIIDNSRNYQCVSFSKICYKYLPKSNQNPPILYDIAYGSLDKGEYKYFELENELPAVHAKLHAHHYKNNDRNLTFGKSFSLLSMSIYWNIFQLQCLSFRIKKLLSWRRPTKIV